MSQEQRSPPRHSSLETDGVVFAVDRQNRSVSVLAPDGSSCGLTFEEVFSLADLSVFRPDGIIWPLENGGRMRIPGGAMVKISGMLIRERAARDLAAASDEELSRGRSSVVPLARQVLVAAQQAPAAPFSPARQPPRRAPLSAFARAAAQVSDFLFPKPTPAVKRQPPRLEVFRPETNEAPPPAPPSPGRNTSDDENRPSFRPLSQAERRVLANAHRLFVERSATEPVRRRTIASA